MWNNSVELDVVEVTNQFIHSQVKAKNGIKFFLTVVYASNNLQHRSNAWQGIGKHKNEEEPWVVMGDMNVVLKESEKICNRERETEIIVGDELNVIMNDSGLHDLKYMGYHFTWSNGSTFCKLDRVMSNDKWEDVFMDSIVRFGDPDVSDHSPAILSILPKGNAKRIPFRFKNLWCDDEEFESIVRSVWSIDIEGCVMFQIIKKLKMLKSKFKDLNRRKYTIMSERVERARQEIHIWQRKVHEDIQNDVYRRKRRRL